MSNQSTNEKMATQIADGNEEPLGKYGYTPHEVVDQPETTADSLRANAGNIAVSVGLTALALNPNAQIVGVDDPGANKVDPAQHQEQVLNDREAADASQLQSGEVYDQMVQANTIVVPQTNAAQNGLGPNER
jgi:hypothetical protein